MRLPLARVCTLGLLLVLGACSATASPASPTATAFDSPTEPLATLTLAPTETASPLPAASPVVSQSPIAPLAYTVLLCKGAGPEVYLVIGAVRHHIVDWDTFLNLGYSQEEIAACPEQADYSDGAPLVRLLKGSGDAIYWMENGVRHHIPDMATFRALGYQEQNIVQIPNDLLASWPLGNALPSVSTPSATPLRFTPVLPAEATANPRAALHRELKIGNYTISQWLHVAGSGMYDWATISAPGQPEIKLDFVQDIGTLPAPDITGEGEPDVLFDTYAGGSHCCWGTVIYSLGATPRKVLDIQSTFEYYLKTGRGELVDLNGDGRYEFVTFDPLDGLPCSQPAVRVVLQYDPVQGRYVGTSPRYPVLYAQDIIQDTALAEKYKDESRKGYKCGVYPIIADYLYRGQVDTAREELHRLYLGSDVEEFWTLLQTVVSHGRFFVA